MNAIFTILTFNYLFSCLSMFFAEVPLKPGAWIHLNITSKDDNNSKLVPFEGLKQRKPSELLQLPSFLVQTKFWAIPLAKLPKPILHFWLRSNVAPPYTDARLKTSIRRAGDKWVGGILGCRGVPGHFGPWQFRPITISAHDHFGPQYINVILPDSLILSK